MDVGKRDVSLLRTLSLCKKSSLQKNHVRERKKLLDIIGQHLELPFYLDVSVSQGIVAYCF